MRTPALILSLALAGCSSESGISEELPVEPSGNPPPLSSDTFTDVFIEIVPPVPVADVLWVIDGSCSMQQELAFLADHFPTFMRTIDESSVDYRVAVTGTNMNRAGELMTFQGRSWIDRSTANPTAAYVIMANAAGSGGASGFNFDATAACLDPENGSCITTGFRREDEPIHTVVVTDEPDFSNIGPSRFVEFYSELAETPPERTFSGILDLGRTQAYVQAIEQIGGEVVDVNTAEWDRMLQQFAEMTAASAELEEFHLSRVPFEETLELAVFTDEGRNEIAPPARETWWFNARRNSVVIENLPEGEYELHVSYVPRSEVENPTVEE